MTPSWLKLCDKGRGKGGRGGGGTEEEEEEVDMSPAEVSLQPLEVYRGLEV